MNFEIESPFSFQSSSLICTPPKNPNLVSETSQFVSHKRKGGRKKFKETRHPIYRGVRQRKGKWVCELREPKKTSRIWLGTYPTPEMAARAHDVGALVIRGTSAILNFPNSLSFLPIVNSSSSHKDIRAAAAEAAESFRPITSFNQKIGRKTKCKRFTKVSSIEEKKKKTVGTEKSIEDLSSTHVFFDEEAFFNMPSLLDRMAESLGVFPLPYQDYLDDYAYCMDFNLWTD
ncbi:dehydration-responsive element-binding protein 1F [Cajanus cajan]|uniref:dehydration-responsive element-binding protein 1F n=1 Tax=Cajanus cajan TaxID=3821 RepID=UPI00098D8B63|nr:dehydration-responsive element-binding protein 1F [Cajanus cajan]